MENLGVCADLTGGRVEVVDLQELSATVGAVLEKSVLGTGAEVRVIMGSGELRDSEASVEHRGSASIALRRLGNVTSGSDISLELDVARGWPADGEAPLPVQVQLRYARPDGAEILQVFSGQCRASTVREAAEADINGTAVALSCLHRSARLAQHGEYRAARVRLISTSRLLQRSMHTHLHQEAYLKFVVQAEQLDGFMRERELQERVFGTSAQRQRDDDASRSMYQMKSMSVDSFLGGA